MDFAKVFKEVGEFVGKKIEENVCELAEQAGQSIAHLLPEWLGGEETKKQALDLFEELSKDVAKQIAKQYFKVDLDKYLD